MSRLTDKRLKVACDYFVNFASREEAVKYRMLAESAPKYEEIYKKLADYEYKEEQGLLTEVILCKDCKYFSGGGLWDNGHWCGRTARVGDCDKVAENDFCSKAEPMAKMGGK